MKAFNGYRQWSTLGGLVDRKINYTGDGWYKGEFDHPVKWAYIVKYNSSYLVEVRSPMIVIMPAAFDYTGPCWYSFLITLFNSRWGFIVNYDANFFTIVPMRS